MTKLLSRDEFRESVFARDRYKCVFCGKSAEDTPEGKLDAHHIIERQQVVPMTDEQDAYKQTEGSKNCMQCAAAYMLGLPLAEVPDFERAGPQAWESFYEFFEGRGFTAEMFPPSVEIEGDYLASGDTERGTSHMVVMRGGKLLHDPHPSNAGLKSVQVVWLIARRSVCITAPAGGEGKA